MVADQEGGQFGLAQAHSDPVAGDPGLGDLELDATDAVPVANADFVVRQAVDGEVFAELPVAEVVAPEVLLPVLVRLDLVHQDGTLLAAVPQGVALAVPLDVQAADHPRALHRVLPDAGAYGRAVPGHVLWQPNVN